MPIVKVQDDTDFNQRGTSHQLLDIFSKHRCEQIILYCLYKIKKIINCKVGELFNF